MLRAFFNLLNFLQSNENGVALDMIQLFQQRLFQISVKVNATMPISIMGSDSEEIPQNFS